MAVKLDVRKVGFLNNLKDDPRPPESFAFPACMTSLMECIGEDARWQTIRAHNREWSKRGLNDAILAATGMGFGLLWHKDICPSSFDLTLVNQHDSTIQLAFDYMGYDCEIVYKDDSSYDEIKSKITQSLDAGRPVLAFGIVGPPECSIVCGYDDGGDTLLGWSHFQSTAPEHCDDSGMFRVSDWHSGLWNIVLCGDKKPPQDSLKDIVRRGIAITTAEEIGGYYSGTAAYDAWAEYVSDTAYDTMADDELKGKFWFHDVLVGNHAEARCYLGDFIHESAGDDAQLHRIADIYNQIHGVCWRHWMDVKGMGAEAYTLFKDKSKRDKAVELIREVQQLDFSAVTQLKAWLDE